MLFHFLHICTTHYIYIDFIFLSTTTRLYVSNQKNYICFRVYVCLLCTHLHKSNGEFKNVKKRRLYETRRRSYTKVKTLLYRYLMIFWRWLTRGGATLSVWVCVSVRARTLTVEEINFILFSCTKRIERGRGTFLINVGYFFLQIL